MNLEDHLGDIIRKARMMTNVSAANAARAAGLTESELAALEESGKAAKKANVAALAPLIGLHTVKLESIATGWLPISKNLGAWRQLRCFTTDEGMAVNNYLIWDEAVREAALFDTGWNVADALKVITENNLSLRHLFLTHTHEDHVAAMGTVRTKFPNVQLHSNSKRAPAKQQNRPDDVVQLGSLQISNRDTPGHAEDGVTYVISNWPGNAPQVAIVGDAIFAASMGRGNQSWDLARQKVRDQILSLPPDTLICPGHGPLTSVAEEKTHNPFF